MPEARTPIEQVNQLIRGIQFAMLTTIRPDQSLHSCPVAMQQADAEGHLWFFALANSEEVNALRQDKHVCVSFADPDGQRYVSITGVGDLVRSEPKAKELWNPLYKSWFPEGLNNSNLLLIKVLILEAEYWYGREGRRLQVLGFAKAPIMDEGYQPSGHAVVEMVENQRDRNR